MDDDDLSFPDEAPPVEQLLIEMGRLLRDTNNHVRRIRVYMGCMLLIALVGVIMYVLWLAGVITVDFKPIGTGF